MTFSHNISDVISDIDDVQSDLRRNVRRYVGAAMKVMRDDAIQYIIQDPNARGQLLQSLSLEEQNLVFRVGTNVPYAPIVEFGSGKKGAKAAQMEYQYGNQVPPEWPSESSSVPPQFPFDAPDIPNNRGNPKFNAFVSHIADWMTEKGIRPETGDKWFSATLIAEEIIANGTHPHPFLRPAFYDNRRAVTAAARTAVSQSV
jgi:HK97 gp10 family phage protein